MANRDIITRSAKGSALTHAEMDQNLASLNQDVDEKTSDYIVIFTDQNKTIQVNKGTAITITLDSISTIQAATDVDDFKVTIKNIGAGPCTITSNAADAIDVTAGAASIILSQWDSVTLQTTPSADWAIINGAVWPSFSVHRNGTDQLNITGTDKVEWTTEEFDTNNNFDSSTNYRFTPTVAGKYLLTATIYWLAVTSVDILVLYLYKNGTEYKTNTKIASATVGNQTISAVVDANGSSDYFEIFASNAMRDTSDILGTALNSFFTGCRIG